MRSHTMQRVMKYGIVGLILLVSPGVAHATLIGDLIDIEWNDDSGLVLIDPDVEVRAAPPPEVVCPGVSVLCGAPVQGFVIDVDDSSISFRGAIVPNPTSTQLVFSSLDWVDPNGIPIDGVISSVSVRPGSTLLGTLFVTEHSITVEGLGSSDSEDLIFTLDIVARHGDGNVPEPSTLFLMGLGLLALRRRG